MLDFVVFSNKNVKIFQGQKNNGTWSFSRTNTYVKIFYRVATFGKSQGISSVWKSQGITGILTKVWKFFVSENGHCELTETLFLRINDLQTISLKVWNFCEKCEAVRHFRTRSFFVKCAPQLVFFCFGITYIRLQTIFLGLEYFYNFFR